MDRTEFEKCCQALEEGNEIYLENFGSRESGRLLYCRADQFQVAVDGRRVAWPAAACEEIASSSEVPHDGT